MANTVGPRGRILTVYDTAYTLRDSDNGNTLCFDNADAITVTIPLSLQIGWRVSVVQQGDGGITFEAETGVTLHNLVDAAEIAGQWTQAELKAVAQNIFNLAVVTSSPAILVQSGPALSIGEMTAAELLDGSEMLPLVQAGENVQGTTQDIIDFATATPTTVRTVSGTTDTVLTADINSAVRYTSAGAVTVTVPAGLGEGFNCLILQLGAGTVGVTAGAGVTILNRQSRTHTAGQGAQCSLFADAADHLLFAGDTA